DAVVHDEGRARTPAALAQPLGHRQEPAGRPLLLPELNHAAAAGECLVQDRLEVPPPRRGAVEDDVERRVHQPRSRSVATLVRWLSAGTLRPPGGAHAVMRPALGANVSGSSALIRHSMAWPSKRTASWRYPSPSPSAMRICSRTRSMPVTISVTGCSTWIRVF